MLLNLSSTSGFFALELCLNERYSACMNVCMLMFCLSRYNEWGVGLVGFFVTSDYVRTTGSIVYASRRVSVVGGLVTTNVRDMQQQREQQQQQRHTHNKFTNNTEQQPQHKQQQHSNRLRRYRYRQLHKNRERFSGFPVGGVIHVFAFFAANQRNLDRRVVDRSDRHRTSGIDFSLLHTSPTPSLILYPTRQQT